MFFIKKHQFQWKQREHCKCMNTASRAESLRSFYLHVASMSSGPSLLKDLAALKWTAGSPLPTTLPKAWLKGRKDTQDHDYMGHSILKGWVEQYGWFLAPCHINSADCFVKEGVSGEEEQWVYAALLMHLQPSKTGESLLPSTWGKLQVGAGCRSLRNRDAAVTGRSGRLERVGTLFAVWSKPHPRIRGDGKETLLGIQRFWAVRKLQSADRLKTSMG